MNRFSVCAAVSVLMSGAALAETPVETSLKAVVTEAFKPTGMPDERISQIVEKILGDYTAVWTAEDAKNLKEGKPLLADFAAIKKRYAACKGHKLGSLFAKKVNSEGLSHIEKRALADFLPMIEKQVNRSLATMAINNGKDIYVGLRVYAFKRAGVLPGKKEDGKTANEIFRILFEKGIVTQETPFFVKGMTGFSAGDGKVTGAAALAAGENVWSYQPGVNIVQDKAHLPILVCPLIEKDGVVVADPVPFGGSAIVVRADGSAVVLPIGDKGEIKTEVGNLLSAKHPIWKNKDGAVTGPDFRLPEKLKK